jgi:hypothetical protein
LRIISGSFPRHLKHKGLGIPMGVRHWLMCYTSLEFSGVRYVR